MKPINKFCIILFLYKCHLKDVYIGQARINIKENRTNRKSSIIFIKLDITISRINKMNILEFLLCFTPIFDILNAKMPKPK